MKDSLLAYLKAGFKASVNGLTVQVTQIKESSCVDTARLKSEHPEVYESVLKPKKGYLKLEIA